MKSKFTYHAFLLFFITISSSLFAQQLTTTALSANCFTNFDFNATDEGFSSPSIYSNDLDMNMHWDGTRLIQNSGFNGSRSTSTISGVFLNTEINKTTVGFDYEVPNGAEYRIRIISALINPPLEILATTADGPIWTSFPANSGSLCLTLNDNDLPVGTNIRYEISVRATAQGQIIIDNFRRAPQNIPLPVTFLGLIARENTDKTTRLIWNVAEESNVKKYIVQSSSDGINFSETGAITASQKDNYYYNTTEVLKGVTYFRIISQDFDGKEKYSGIIKIRGEEPTANGIINLYPVPANDVLFVEHKKLNKPANVIISGLDGKVVYQTVTQANSYQTSINVSLLPKGLYLIKYQLPDGETFTKKFIKQ